MTEERLRNEVLDYMNFLCLCIETIDPRMMHDYVELINYKVEEYERNLRETYSLELKR